ncbi:MAG: zf-HC2 domain-containing protein [Anaerolineae bacterium]|nr:zf-HC2 domain-containing protein [Anaerolineae bacterium]
MQHVTDLLAEYYDNELPVWRRQQVESHLSGCADCRAALSRLQHLSNVIADYALPDALTPAETFRAQVMLKVAHRKKTRSPYHAWFWYAVPVGLGTALVILQAIVALLILLVTVLGWSGVEIVESLAPSVDPQTIWGDLLVSSSIGLVNLLVRLVLYFVLFLTFLPYAGWVGLLWRSTQKQRV